MLKFLKRSGKTEFPYDVIVRPAQIIADAAIATQIVGDGRFVPLLIIDTSQRSDIEKLIEIHNAVPPGDALSVWGSTRGSPSHISLIIRFERPVEADLVLNFDVAKQGGIIDLANRSRAIYLQSGRPGDRFSTSLDAPRIIIELGGYMNGSHWQKCWEKALRIRYRREGLGRSESKKMAREHILAFRNVVRNPDRYQHGIFVGPNSKTDDSVP